MVCVGPEPTDPEKMPTITYYAEGKPDKRRTCRVKGNDFAKKITYRTTENAQELIKSFRLDYPLRVAVTVDMIATGTDVNGRSSQSLKCSSNRLR